MAQICYEIDPSADTVLVLKNPNASFARWSPDDVEGDDTEPAGGGANEKILDQAAGSVTSSCQTCLVDDCTPEQEIHYRVSSRHLALASTIFRNMLSGEKWNEGTRNVTDGLFHLSAHDWDTEAVLLFLNVLHHRNRRVPKTVDLEMLAKLAVLADYYCCTEALEPSTERWIQHLKVASPIPSQICRDLMLWMCIAWVFKLPKEFVQTTTVAVRRSDGELSALGLPITSCVDRIEQDRAQAIATIFSKLQGLIADYRSQSYTCPSGDSFECGSILFGALTREMERLGFLPIPTAPYVGWGISELRLKLSGIQSPSWTSPDSGMRSKHYCNLKATVLEIADSVIRLANGPCLDDVNVEQVAIEGCGE